MTNLYFFLNPKFSFHCLPYFIHFADQNNNNGKLAIEPLEVEDVQGLTLNDESDEVVRYGKVETLYRKKKDERTTSKGVKYDSASSKRTAKADE